MAKKKLTKAEIIENVFEKTNLSKKNIHEVIDYVFEEIKRALGKDLIVELRGFGTFEIKTRKGRAEARNPKTGETFSVQNHGVTIFRPGQEIKKMSWPLRK